MMVAPIGRLTQGKKKGPRRKMRASRGDSAVKANERARLGKLWGRSGGEQTNEKTSSLKIKHSIPRDLKLVNINAYTFGLIRVKTTTKLCSKGRGKGATREKQRGMIPDRLLGKRPRRGRRHKKSQGKNLQPLTSRT